MYLNVSENNYTESVASKEFNETDNPNGESERRRRDLGEASDIGGGYNLTV